MKMVWLVGSFHELFEAPEFKAPINIVRKTVNY